MSRDTRPVVSAFAIQSTDADQPPSSMSVGPAIGRQFLTFAAVGAIGTAAHYAVLVLLVEGMSASPTIATTVGFVCGAVVNYVLNRRFTFASARRHRAALPQFLCIAALGGVANSIVVAALTSRPGVNYLVAQVIATGVVLVWNFLANRYWTFRT
jgi:putative flippase GtrA